MVFHPIDCIDIVRRDYKRVSLVAVPVFVGLSILMNYVCIFFTHYSMGSRTPTDANFLLEAALVIIPLLSWTVAAYAMSAILNGESRFCELLTVSSYGDISSVYPASAQSRILPAILRY